MKFFQIGFEKLVGDDQRLDRLPSITRTSVYAAARAAGPERVRPAPARLGLPAKRLTFFAVVIAEAFGTLAGRRGFALRFAGEAAVAAAVAVLEAVVDAGLPRRCRRGSVDRHQRHARNRNRRSQPV